MTQHPRSVSSRGLAPLAGTIMVALLAACGGGNRNAADSTAAASPGIPSDSAAPAVGAHADSGGMSDANIMAAEMGGDSAEVAVVKSVQSRLSAGPVRDYAALLVKDHSKSLSDARTLAGTLAITPVPPAGDTTAVATDHLVKRFAGMSGHTLDTAFVNHEVEDHQHDIAEAHRMSSAAKNPQVKSLVDNSLPELQKHLDRAQALASGSTK